VTMARTDSGLCTLHIATTHYPIGAKAPDRSGASMEPARIRLAGSPELRRTTSRDPQRGHNERLSKSLS